MAIITSATSGFWSAASTWAGGVVPVLGDRVNIVAGHTVTLDGTFSAGDDTANGITVAGTIKASRSVSSQLTVRGDLFITTGGTLDYGTEAGPIPAGVNAVVLVNDSAAGADNKWGVRTDSATNWAGFRCWGADKNPRSSIAAALSTDVTFTVADATGWLVGDLVLFGNSVAQASVNGERFRAITGISGGPVNALVTVGANLGFASQAGRTVVNLTRNVRFRAVNNTFQSHVTVDVGVSFSVVNAIEIGPCEFNLNGGGGAAANVRQFGALNLYWASTSNATRAVKRIYRPTWNEIWSVSGSVVTTLPITRTNRTGFHLYGNQALAYKLEQPVSGGKLSAPVFIYAGSSTIVQDAHFVAVLRAANTGFSQGPVKAKFLRGYFEGCNQIVTGTGVALEFEDAEFNGLTRSIDGNVAVFGSLVLRRCKVGGALGFYDATVQFNLAVGHYSDTLFDSCIFPTSAWPITTRASAGLAAINAQTSIMLRNKNNDPTLQTKLVRGGRLERDNSSYSRGRASLSMSNWHLTEFVTHTSTVNVDAGATVRIVGRIRFNAAYSTFFPPNIQVEGMGAGFVEFVAPAVTDTWHPFDLSITNPQSYPGAFTIYYVGYGGNSEAARCWFDGIAMPDFVTWTQHYGFTFDPSNPARTVDPVVQLTEAAAAALTGISYADGTLTISGSRSIREVYDWLKQYEASNQLAPIITSEDGVNFTLAANLTLSGAVTGVGALSMAGFNFSGLGASSVPITHSAGVYVAIAVRGMVAGSRLQIYNVTTATELYNEVPGTQFTLNIAWTTNQTIRVRAAYQSGTTALLPVELTGLLTSSGALFLVSQIADPIYSTLAIDGSTCTEFIADYPNLQIDISDPDNVTTVQRIYAWANWAQTTAQGIVLMFKAVQAADTLNFVIDTAVVNAKLDNITTTPVKIGGGYITRSDGTSVIANTSGSIQLDPGRAYLPNLPSGGIPSDIRYVNGTALKGAGVLGDPWGPV